MQVEADAKSRLKLVLITNSMDTRAAQEAHRDAELKSSLARQAAIELSDCAQQIALCTAEFKANRDMLDPRSRAVSLRMAEVSTSASFSAEISVRSPRKLSIFII